MEDDGGAGACGRVLAWEQGLPTVEELTPVSHQLVPQALAAAFLIDVTGTAFDCPVLAHSSSPTSHLSLRCDDEEEGEAEAESEDAGSGSASAACRGVGGTGTGWAGKKARMVWTPELHHRFVQAVAHLGDKGAVPKAIVRLLNVEGLTRENVASHLQKYRIYLKRTRTSPAKPHPPPAFPPAPQQPSDTATRGDYCAFAPRDSEKLERD